VQLVAGKIREDLDARGTPEQLHSFGLSQLLLGRLDAADVAFTAAAREQPLNAAYQSDAAAFYLERARAALRPDDLPRALAAAERARLANPAMLEGAFNRALALERLSLTAQARQAWTEYLSRDSSSSWAAEARRHLETLSSPTALSQWPTIQTLLQRGVDAALADQAVRTHTTGARTFIETELFPAWAAAVDQGAGATERESLRALAAAFAQAGDDLYSDAVTAIDRAESRGAGPLRRLAAAHREYAAAAALLADERFRDAASGLTSARAGLIDAGSAFAARAELDLAVVAFYTGRTDQATQALTALEPLARARHYPFVAGRVSWIQGLIAFGQGQYGAVRMAWETTLATFEQISDSEQLAGAHGLLANLHDVLGDSQQAWAHRSLAMRDSVASRNPRLTHGLLTGAAGQALKEGNIEAALVLQDAAWDNASRQDGAAMKADALTQRAAILLALGRHDEARGNVTAARDYTRLVAEPSLRVRRDIALLSIESQISLREEPAQAAAAAERAIALAAEQNDPSRLAELYLNLALAERAAGRADAAVQAIAKGINAFDRQRALVAGANGTSYGDRAWSLYEIGMRLALERGDTANGFALGSLARTRDSRSASSSADLLARVQAHLGPSEAMVALNQLDDELVVWMVTSSDVQIVKRSLGRNESIRLVSRHRDEIDLEVPRPRASATLFNELVRPLSDRLTNVTHLMVVPDAPYYNVAFAALWDRDRERFVIEDRSVSVLADAGALTQAPISGTTAPRPAFVDIASPSTAEAAFAVWSSAPDRSVVRLTAPVQANNEFPGLSSVMFADTPGRSYSGFVLTREIATRDFSRLGVVILSDCKSGSDSGEGQGTLSAAAAFLSAGVPSVVATLWPIGERERSDLLTGLDRELRRNSSAAAALRSLQRDVLRQNGGRLGAWTGLVAYGVGR
jgi:CHAT domain-containing protein